MKILITGGAGKVGCEVAKIATSLGQSVIAFDLQQANWGVINNVPDVEAYPGDITII